jgi:hypothetical protein
VDPARVEAGRASVGAASWLQPFAGIFGDTSAFPVPRSTASILAFPGCFRGEILKLKAELAEIRRSICVRGG